MSNEYPLIMLCRTKGNDFNFSKRSKIRLSTIESQKQHHHSNPRMNTRVKSGNFGHQVNSDIYLQTVEIQMRRLLMSRLIRIFTVCLVN